MSNSTTDGIHSRLLRTIKTSEYKAIAFHDLNEVPVGSVGYFSPSGKNATRTGDGWMSDRRVIKPAKGDIFTSHHGPANDEKLAELLAAALVAERHLLVDFEVLTAHEPGDWESGQPGYDFTTLTSPRILGHNLNETELAHLYFEIENVGTLGESDAYSNLDNAIRQLGEEPAERLREVDLTNQTSAFDLSVGKPSKDTP